MYVERLRLKAFRNFVEEELVLARGLNVLTGENGQGKTNLLEAIYVAAGRNTPRFGGNANLIAWGEDRTRIEADACARGTAPTVCVDIDHAGRRTVVNGKAVRSHSASPIRAALFCPETLGLVKEGAHARREMIDDLIEREQPSYGRLRAEYGRVLRQRNRLLRDSTAHLGSELGVWNEQLIGLGARVTARRIEACRRLEPLVSEAYATLSGEAEPRVGLRYEGRLVGEDNSATALAARLSRQIDERRMEEHARRMTLVGPHRDELVLTVGEHALRGYGSQGQQRTAALALVFAEAAILERAEGDRPVLLLDDVLSELDPSRRRLLLMTVSGGGQAVVTTANTMRPDDLRADAKVTRVHGGRLADG